MQRDIPDELNAAVQKVLHGQYGICNCCGVTSSKPNDSMGGSDSRLDGGAGNYIRIWADDPDIFNEKKYQSDKHWGTFWIKDKDTPPNSKLPGLNMFIGWFDEDACERKFGDITSHLLKRAESDLKRQQTILNKKVVLVEELKAKMANIGENL